MSHDGWQPNWDLIDREDWQPGRIPEDPELSAYEIQKVVEKGGNVLIRTA